MSRIISSATPSTRVTARKYPEEFAWWRVSGWQLVVEDAADGGLHLFSRKQNTSWGAQATAEQVAIPDRIRYFLAQSLYQHLHPIKSRRAYDLTGEVCTTAELAAFIRQQRRKVDKP